MSNEELIDLMTENILSGGKRTTAEKVRELITAMVESYQNLDGKNQNDGYIGQSNDGGAVVPGLFRFLNSYSISETPNVTLGPGAGSGASVNVAGNNQCGVIDITTGTGCASNAILVKLTMSDSFLFPTSAIGGFHANDENACGVITGLIVTANNDSITISCNSSTSLSDATNYKFFYNINGY